MNRKCIVCNYERVSVDEEPDYSCPKCGVVYAKAASYLEKKAKAEKKLEETNAKKEMARLKEEERKQKKQAKRKTKVKPKDKVVVKNYVGKQARATELYKNDVLTMAKKDYTPISQNWAQGQHGCGQFLLAACLIPVAGLGLLYFAYLIIVKPDGTLSVTYELNETSDTKTCERCAEYVQPAAQVCRFCGFEFAAESVDNSL